MKMYTFTMLGWPSAQGQGAIHFPLLDAFSFTDGQNPDFIVTLSKLQNLSKKRQNIQLVLED